MFLNKTSYENIRKKDESTTVEFKNKKTIR